MTPGWCATSPAACLEPGAGYIREVTRCDPYGNFFIGYCLVNQNNPGPQLVDNAVVTSMMVTRALQSVVHQWYRRFAVPLPYHSGVDGPMLRQTINGLGIGDLGTDGPPDTIRQMRGTRYIAMDVPHTQVYPDEARTNTLVYHFDGLWCDGSTMIPPPDRSATIAPVHATASTGGPSPSQRTSPLDSRGVPVPLSTLHGWSRASGTGYIASLPSFTVPWAVTKCSGSCRTCAGP